MDLPFINDGGDIAFTADLPNGDTAVFVASRRERPTWEKAESDADDRSPAFHNAVNQLRARDLKLLQQRRAPSDMFDRATHFRK